MNNSYSKNGSETYKIATSGIMLALIFIFVLIKSVSLLPPPFPNFLRIDLTTIIIVILLLLVGWKYTIVVAIIKLFMAPLFFSNGYIIGLVGEMAVMIASISFVAFFALSLFVCKKIFKNNFDKDKNNLINILHNNRRKFIILSLIVAIFVATIIITIANGLFITPLYYYLFGQIKDVSFISIQNDWNKFKTIFFNTPNYWVGIFVVYTSFNIIQFSIISFVLSVSLIALDPVYNLINISQSSKDDVASNYVKKKLYIPKKHRKN